MFRISDRNGEVMLEFKGRKVFSHSATSPFISIGNGGIRYKSSHGSFSVKKEKAGSVALDNYKIDGDSLELFRNDIAVKLTFTEKNGILYANIGIRGEIKNVSFSFDSHNNEMFFGGGEQYRKLNFKGEKVTNFVSEHIKVMPIVEKTIFRKFKKYRVRSHSEINSYSPMSTFVSSDKYALRFDTDGYGEQDFTQADKTVFTYWDTPKGFCYITEDSFKDISRKLAEDIPSNPFLPDWAYKGMILGVQGGIKTVKNKAHYMLEQGAQVAGVWCQDWSGKKVTAAGSQVYWNWEADDKLYPELKKEISELKSKGVRFLAYINPYLIVNGKMYNECKEKGYLIKNAEGGIYHITSTTFAAGMMDLTNPDMVKYLKDTIIKKNMLESGIDGYMADFGEYLPVDSVLYDGDAAKLHNEWPVLWAKINREAIAESGRECEIFFFTRSGYNGVQEYTTIMWNGDQHTDFSPDYGLPCVIPASINLGMSGLCAAHSDIGGFISFRNLRRDAELYIRWLEICAFSPLMRGHETIKPQNNVQFDSREILPYVVFFSGIYQKLAPYIKHCMEEARAGIPVIRAPFYEYNDMSLYKEDYVYMLGSELFVAPVVTKGAEERQVYVPQGEWIHLLSGKPYGGGEQSILAPLGVPVVLYKKDSCFAELFASCKIK